jgi:hypothetical protein
VNGDGHSDIVIGAPGECRVYVLSGIDRSVIYNLNSPSGVMPDSRFGRSICVGDVTGDGLADILASNFDETAGGNSGQGRAYLFDGATGTLSLTLDCPTPTIAAAFGFSTGLCDVDGDGLAEMLVGSGGLHQVDIFDGDGHLMRTISDPVPGGSFGSSIATGDVNMDGISDILGVDAK